jgi:type VII secretion-associated serine protease mycosin
VSSVRLRAVTFAVLAGLVISQAPTPASADAVRDKQWYLKSLKIAQAHEITKGAGVTVAIVDTGAAKHSDYAKNLKPGRNFTSAGSSVGQSDTDGHGTAMTGLIVGHGRSADDGILGIAPEAKAVPVKVVGSDDNQLGPATNRGIAWAAQSGAKVINVSLSTGPSLGLKQAVESASTNDVVVVAGSGNRPAILQLGYPAAIPGVLAVGAVDRSGKHASFSVGGEAIQLCAPGVDMETTGRNGTYVVGRGTSDATAVVSGAVALVRARFPDLNAPEVIERLTSTATDIGLPGRDDECGFGVLNIVKALTADAPSAGGTASATASPAPDGAPTTGAAQPSEPESQSNTVAIVAASVGGGVAVLGALIALFLARRRRT